MSSRVPEHCSPLAILHLALFERERCVLVRNMQPNFRMQWLSACFYMVAAAVVMLVIGPWMWFMTGEEPFSWAACYVLLSPHRLMFAAYWVMAVTATLLALERDIFGISKVSAWNGLGCNFAHVCEEDPYRDVLPDQEVTSRCTGCCSQLQNIVLRKIFHGVAVVMFTPCIATDLPFMSLAFAVAASAFIFAEYLRVCGVWPMANALDVCSHDQGLLRCGHLGTG
jgi:hypothetical protein